MVLSVWWQEDGRGVLQRLVRFADVGTTRPNSRVDRHLTFDLNDSYDAHMLVRFLGFVQA